MLIWNFSLLRILSFGLKLFRLFVVFSFNRVFNIAFLLSTYITKDIDMSTSGEFVFVLNDLDNIYIKRALNRQQERVINRQQRQIDHVIFEDLLESSDRIHGQIAHVEIQLSIKRLLNDVTVATNNAADAKRQKKKSRSKSDFKRRAVRFTSSPSRSSISSGARQIRRSERLTSRSSLFSQSMSSKNHEDLVDWEKFLNEELREVENDDFVYISQYEQQAESITTRRDRSRNDAVRNNDDFVSLFQLKRQSFISSSTSRGVCNAILDATIED